MSLTEILAEIPKLSFAERQELVRRAPAPEDEEELTPEEKAILDQRLEDFRRNPAAGISMEQLKSTLVSRINDQRAHRPSAAPW